ENFSSLPTVLGLIFGSIGVFMLFAEQLFAQGDSAGEKSTKIMAMFVLVCGTIAWTVGSLISKYNREKRTHQMQKNGEEDIHVMVKTAWQMVCAGIAFTVVASLNGEYAHFQAQDVMPEDWGAIIYLATMGSILAFGSYIWLLQYRPTTEVSTHAYINPIVALLLAHYFTDHQVTFLQTIGLVGVLGSVLLMNWNLYKNNQDVTGYYGAKRIETLIELAPHGSSRRIMALPNLDRRKEKKKKVVSGEDE